ncbi:fosfomycin resistance glutathione transferase [Cardiobacteriaceae bacterium TAE3-ERU3]|nr:fosfomycin resistance glutathione transferase [Cardiobacteriaceae bacterium TAE3-ERU3]
MLTSLNHITLAVQNLEVSLTFYTEILGFKPSVRWDNGAYLHLGSLWLCLSVDAVSPRSDYTHIAFTIEKSNFETFAEKLKQYQVPIWKQNKSEGDSIYFLDPDQHKLEAHVDNLQSRLSALHDHPYAGLQWLS